MARILGIDIPKDKRIVISLTYIFGIGVSTSKKILKEAKIKESIRVSELTDSQITKIREVANKYETEGDLRRKIAINIKRLMEIGSYKGYRHRQSLPVRGKKSKTNARTRKRPRKTVSSKKIIRK